MNPTIRRRVLAMGCGTAMLSGLAVAGTIMGGSAFTPMLGWPLTLSGNSVDGGAHVDLDGDGVLDLLQVNGSVVRALRLDGTNVPGWPRTMNNSTFSPPAVGDIDGDGDVEVVVHSFFYGIGGRVQAWHHDGTTVSGFPLSLGGTVKHPTLGDVDGDGDLDILSVQNNGVGRVYAIDEFGNVMDGWPQFLDSVGASGASIGDVDGDGNLEIYAMSYYQVYGFRTTGALLEGFPFIPGNNETFNYNSISLADIDDDGDRELVTATSNEVNFKGRVYVLQHDGTVMNGWPQETGWAIFTPPSVADIDGDGALDVMVGDQTLSPEPVNALYAWKGSGAPLSGFPISNLNAIHTQIMVADIDGDDDLELLADDNSFGSGLFAWNHDGTLVSGWPIALGGSSFLQVPNVSDLNGDGFMELTTSGLNLNDDTTTFTIHTSTIPYSAARAPVATYQYNLRRDGMVPDLDETLCAADLNGSGSVDVDDMLALLAAWGGPDADLNDDGFTDVDDLLILLAAWGPCA